MILFNNQNYTWKTFNETPFSMPLIAFTEMLKYFDMDCLGSGGW